jgi:uncharacterized protein (DUF433 family)
VLREAHRVRHPHLGCLILGKLADGMSVDDLLKEYPSLSESDVRACLAFGARASNGHFVDMA